MNSILAVIPARGGSKRVPSKNIRWLDDKPLIVWSIEAARKVKAITSVVVSSDSAKIREIAHDAGAHAVERPKELATDGSSLFPVLVHAVEMMGRPDIIVTLQPTCPFRPDGLIEKCIAVLRYKELDSVFTVWQPGHYGWQRKFPGLVQQLNCPSRLQSQEMGDPDQIYIESGSVFVTRTDSLLKYGERVCGKKDFLVIEPEDAIDIDTEWDLWLAEQRARYVREHQGAA